MTRTFFQKFPLFTFLTAYFIVCLLSLLPYPALANPPPLGIHKASSYLFTRSLTASSSLFFSRFLSSASATAADLRVGEPLGLDRVSLYSRETHGSPASSQTSGGIRRNWFVLLCLPSLHPTLLPCFCPHLLSGRSEENTHRHAHTQQTENKK